MRYADWMIHETSVIYHDTIGPSSIESWNIGDIINNSSTFKFISPYI